PRHHRRDRPGRQGRRQRPDDVRRHRVAHRLRPCKTGPGACLTLPARTASVGATRRNGQTREERNLTAPLPGQRPLLRAPLAVAVTRFRVSRPCRALLAGRAGRALQRRRAWAASRPPRPRNPPTAAAAAGSIGAAVQFWSSPGFRFALSFCPTKNQSCPGPPLRLSAARSSNTVVALSRNGPFSPPARSPRRRATRSA